MSDEVDCIFCNSKASWTSVPTPWRSEYQCKTCGTFTLSIGAMQRLINEQSLHKAQYFYRYAAFTRNQTERGQNIRLTDGEIFDEDSVTLDYVMNDFPTTVADRIDRTLLNFSELGPIPGDEIKCFPTDYTKTYSESPRSMDFLLRQLHTKGLLDVTFDRPYTGFDAVGRTELKGQNYAAAKLTLDGWNKIADIQRGMASRPTSQAFVAMWFDKTMDEAFDKGFKIGISKAGYIPRRIDKVEHVNKIDDEIIAEIRKSKFVVADFTAHRSGVYFEAGFALGLGLKVIWTVRADELKECHLDTRQYNHIVWSDPEDLAKQLKNRIEANMGPGPEHYAEEF